MKPNPLRARPLLQADLFDSATALAPLTGLQRHHDELVELLSQLLWQVASRADVAEQLENDDEQDQS
ncbi:MAG: hypothetical protein ACYCSN_09340 [Acidobacteriaceae bacterium]